MSRASCAALGLGRGRRPARQLLPAREIIGVPGLGCLPPRIDTQHQRKSRRGPPPLIWARASFLAHRPA